jgi:hypothetical protein
MDVHPENKLSSFKTVLPDNGLHLDGEWEVALSELVFPTHIKNVLDGGFRYRNLEGDDDMGQLTIEPGIYESATDILKAMQEVLKPHYASHGFPGWDVSINPQTRKLGIGLPNDSSYLLITSIDLKNVLGYSNSGWLSGKGPHVSFYPVDIQRVHTMFVYTNIIQHQIVGDTKAPLLRSVVCPTV